MSDWIELPGYPRTFNPQGAPWTGAVRVVHGVVELSGNRPVMLRPDRAFLQKIEAELIEAYKQNKDVAAVVEATLLANERHIDQVEWCRVLDDDLDLSIRVYASRGAFRLYLALSGPVGRHANDTPPERKKTAPSRPKKAAAPARKASPAPAPAPALASPSAPLHLRPIAPEAGACHGDVLAFDDAGRLHAALRLPGDADYHYATIEPTGRVTLSPLPTRDALRATDVGAMTAALMPGLVETSGGLVKIEHYSTARGEHERITIERGAEGQAHVSRRGLFDASWALGVWENWFLRLISLDGGCSLVAVDLASNKRTKTALPALGRVWGAEVERSSDGGLLRIVSGAEEHRLALRVGKSVTLDVDAVETRPHGQPGVVVPVAGSGWLVAEASGGQCGLWLARPDGQRDELFRLPGTFDASLKYRPWDIPAARLVSRPGEPPLWLATFGFGPDEVQGPMCRGAVLLDASGAVRARSWSEADGTLQINGASLAGVSMQLGYAARPTGDLAALVSWDSDLSVLWYPPTPRGA